MVSLTHLSGMPDGFLDCGARDLVRMFDGPTLIELPGPDRAPLFVSILQHGNEDSGLGAVQRILRARERTGLPRPVMALIGNVEAAGKGQRRLDGQPDYNRVWPGASEWIGSPEAEVMQQVHARVTERRAFAAIDLHNNTGRNPHYGVVCSDDPSVLGLAALFAPRAVRFRGLPGTQTASFSGLVPAMTAECGQPGIEANAVAAANFLNAVLDLDELPSGPDPAADFELFHTLGVVRVKEQVALGDCGEEPRFALAKDIDSLNFRAVPAGTSFGRTDHSMPVDVIDEGGKNIAQDFFEVQEGQLRLSFAAVPAMLTTDHRLIRQDCLCYLMERLR